MQESSNGRIKSNSADTLPSWSMQKDLVTSHILAEPPPKGVDFLRQKIAILGGAGHAKMVIEAMQSTEDYLASCCLVPETEPVGKVLEVPLRSESESLLRSLQSSGHGVFVAIGCNRLRRRLTERLHTLNLEFATVISQAAWVSPSARLGPGCVIMPGAVVGASAVVGEGCIINSGATVDHDCQLESFVHVGPGSHLAGNVTVGTGSFLGVGCSVIPEVNIHADTTVGAGTVVVGDLRESGTYVGVPAKLLNPKRLQHAA